MRRRRRWCLGVLYANPGAEGFYRRLGFLPMNTAMAVWSDPDAAIEAGILRRPEPGSDARS
jgi:hypothetical protein